MRIEHVAIWTRDIEELRAFYETHFAAQAGPKYVNPTKQFESYFLSFASGARLEIMQTPSAGPAPQSSDPLQGYAHLALSVGSEAEVDRLTRHLHDSGCQVLSQPRRTGDGCYESVIADPDGNAVEITA